MKTRFALTISAVILLTLASLHLQATVYTIIHVDSTFTNGITVTYCPGTDSIMLIGPTGVVSNNWAIGSMYIYNNTDTLVLAAGTYYGIRDSIPDYPHYIYFHLAPLRITGDGGSVACGDSIRLAAVTNYEGPGTPAFSWTPATGLSNPNVANPYVHPTTAYPMIYTVTITVNGCVVSDTATVMYSPGIAAGICMVGVDSATHKNLIIYEKPVTTLIEKFAIYRETDVTGVYVKIGEQPYAALNDFIDTASNPGVQSNRYKLSVTDNCNFELPLSDFHKTMHLTINQGVGNVWNLIWEAYEGFTVPSYKIYRGTAPGNLQLIGTTSGSSTQYSDFTAPAGYVYYQVKAVCPVVCTPWAFSQVSSSNIASNSPIGIFETGNEPGWLSLYPNPVHDNLEVTLTKKSKIEVLTIDGQLLKTIAIADHQLTIDLSALSSGVYFIRATTDQGVSVKRFVKR